MLISRRAFPFKFMLGRETDFMFAAVIDVPQRFALHLPLKGFHIGGCFADLKDHVQKGAGMEELRETRVLVVAIEFREVALELRFRD